MSQHKSFWSGFDRSRGKSAVHHKSELTTSGYIGRDLAKSEQIDVLSSMQNGAKLLKLCSRRTRSHWRKFQLDSSNLSIKWVSDKKAVDDTTIQITNIVDIVCFDKNVVEKFKDTLPEEYNNSSLELQQQQFTIRYMVSNKHNYLPQLSPNHSLTVNNNSTQMPIINGLSLNGHQSKNSNSFIRSLRSSNNNSNNNNNNHVDESVTDSSSNKHQSRQRSGSFWKLKNKLNNNNNTKEQTPEMENEHKYHERNYTDSIKISGGYHIQELHLMAETAKIANIWIYGLERLCDACKNNVDLLNLTLLPFEYNKFRISYKQLMMFAFERARRGSIGKHNNNNLYNDESTISPFKSRLERINTALYGVIEQLPQSQQSLLEDRKTTLFHTDSKRINCLMKKIRKDQNDLDDILRGIHKKRLNKTNLREWSYTLTRIEINVGGYQIAINNQYLTNDIIGNGVQREKTQHKRERSKSSSIYSMNYQNHFQHSAFIPPHPNHLQQQYSGNNLAKYHSKSARRQSREHSNHNKPNILKDRSPRSPFSPFSNDNKLDDSTILRPPNSPHGMEKYDSI